jgi:hypothetical protein
MGLVAKQAAPGAVTSSQSTALRSRPRTIADPEAGDEDGSGEADADVAARPPEGAGRAG